MKCFKNKDILGNIKEIYIVQIIKNLKLDFRFKFKFKFKATVAEEEKQTQCLTVYVSL